jgi:hypothetical protein
MGLELGSRTSDAGKAEPNLAWANSLTANTITRYTVQLQYGVPPANYCTKKLGVAMPWTQPDHAARGTGSLHRLCASMKSEPSSSDLRK